MFQTSSGCFSDESIYAERNLPLVSRAKRMGLSDFRQTNQGISLTYLPRVSTVNISQKLNFLSFPVARRVLWPPLSFFNCNHRIKIHHLGKFSNFVAWQQLVEIHAGSPTLSGANVNQCTGAKTVGAENCVKLSAPTIEGNLVPVAFLT